MKYKFLNIFFTILTLFDLNKKFSKLDMRDMKKSFYIINFSFQNSVYIV